MFYLVVDAVEVGLETLVEPPAGVADLGTDVARVRCAEALLVVVPTERILHRAAETRHMEAVLVLLTVSPAAGEDISINKLQFDSLISLFPFLVDVAVTVKLSTSSRSSDIFGKQVFISDSNLWFNDWGEDC